MSRFLLSAEARLDYFEAFDFIYAYSPRAALKWEAKILETFAHLATWPQTGMVRPEFAPPHLRFWIADDYLILYNPSSDPVEIVAILHGAQDLYQLIAGRMVGPGAETTEH